MIHLWRACFLPPKAHIRHRCSSCGVSRDEDGGYVKEVLYLQVYQVIRHPCHFASIYIVNDKMTNDKWCSKE